MKKIKVAVLTTVLLLIGSGFASAAGKSSAEIMKKAAELSGNSVMDKNKLENGVVFNKTSSTPAFSKSLVRALSRLEQNAAKQYIKALEKGNDELNCTVQKAREDIRLCLGSTAVEIVAKFNAKLNGKIVGYALELNNHADASIIQDGSWIIIYLDDKMNVIDIQTGQS